jgi:uncharacterized protein (DUF2235 family)
LLPKNILIFADGTGNESGLLPDESRTNVYKLFRATRTGPDTTIDPEKQIAFYVPGVGTPGTTPPSIWKRVWKGVEQAVGGGFGRCGLLETIQTSAEAILKTNLGCRTSRYSG